MDTSLDKLQHHLIEQFQARGDAEKKGKISIVDAREVLLQSKMVSLTPLQVQILIGLSKPDHNGMINYKEFSFKCKDMIDELFSMKSLKDKSLLIQQGSYIKPDEHEEE